MRHILQASVAVIALAVGASSASADILTATFTGTIVSVNDGSNEFKNATIGESFTGSFTINTATLSADQCAGYGTGGCYNLGVGGSSGTVSFTINGVTSSFSELSGNLALKDEFAGGNTDWFQPSIGGPGSDSANFVVQGIRETVIGNPKTADYIVPGGFSVSTLANTLSYDNRSTFNDGTATIGFGLTSLSVNVGGATPAPEPASMALLATGVAGLGAAMRRKRRA